MSAFDLRGLLQWTWLQGDDEMPAGVAARCRQLLEDPAGQPATAVRGVAEWWWRVSVARDADRDLVHATLLRAIASELRSSAGTANSPAAGIHRLVALRRARLLDLDGVPGAPAGSWVEAIMPPEHPESLRRSFDDLKSQATLLPVRTPY